MDLEAAGAAATAGLASGVIERPTGKAGEHHPTCADCGVQTIGRFCHNCGQPSHIHRTLLHLGEELLHGVMHFDGRIWRTLPLLLFRPGRLTRDWVHGKRSRYVSPLALFLFTVFVTFMAFSMLPHAEPKTIAQAKAEAQAELLDEQGDLARAEARLAKAAPEDRADADENVLAARRSLLKAEAQVRALQGIDARTTTPEAVEQVLNKGQGRKLNIHTGWASLDTKIEHVAKNPELAAYKLKNSFYKFSFLLVPLSIPFVALLFLWKRGFTLYDHGVFVLYSLTFVSLYVLASVLAGAAVGGLGVLAFSLLPLVVPIHMYAQLKGAYGLRTFSAVWRTGFLLIFCSIVALLFSLAVAWLAF